MMGIQEIINKKRHKRYETTSNIEVIYDKDIDNNKDTSEDAVSNELMLKLTYKNARALLDRWAADYIESKNFDTPLTIGFDDESSVTHAKTKHITGQPYEIKIGRKELSSENGEGLVKDMDFITAAVALYHEIAHYEQDMISSKTEEDFITEFSTFEIKAEHSGVMVAWDRMRQTWPAKNNGHYLIDDLMLKRLTERAITSNYCLKVPGYDREKNKDARFESREQVDGLFNKAEVLAPIRRHRLADEFTDSAHCNDDLAQMMVYESGGVRPEYNPFYISLMHEESGPAFDKKMASLIAHIYPNRKEIWSK